MRNGRNGNGGPISGLFREDARKIETGETEYIAGETKLEYRRLYKGCPRLCEPVLVLKEYGELNYKEIGRILGISEGNVKVRVFRAREQLAA